MRKIEIIYSAFGTLAALGCYFLYVGTHRYPVLDAPQMVAASLAYSLPVAALSLLGMRLGYGADIFRMPHRWLIVIVVVASLFICGAAATFHLNGKLDGGNRVIKTLPIIDKRKLTARGATSYYAVVNSWRAGRKEERIRITRHEYANLSLPATVEFTLAPGNLAYPWIARYSLPGNQPLQYSSE